MKIESKLLKRLGPVPYWRAERKCLEALDVHYRQAAAKAAAVVRKCGTPGA